MRGLIALVVLAFGGFSLAADPPVEPITKPGEQTLFDGKVRVQVAADDKTTKFEVTFVGSAGGVAKKFEVKSADAKGWFVVVESAGRVWLYRGGDALFLLEYADNPPGGPAGSKSSTVGFAPGGKTTAEALVKAPKSVVERLPALFKVPTKDK